MYIYVFNLFNNFAMYDIFEQIWQILPVNCRKTLTDYLIWGIAY